MGVSVLDVGGIGKGSDRNEPIDLTKPEHKLSIELNHFCIPAHYAGSISHMLLSNGMIQDRIEKMAMDIRKVYQNEELHILCVLKGSRGFFNSLLKYLTRISCYTRTSSNSAPFLEHYARIQPRKRSDEIQDITIVSEDLSVFKGKHVLVCEDLINTGKTLQMFCAKLLTYAPKSIKVASLLEKKHETATPFHADFCGFAVPSTDFVVGFSLDHNEGFRDLDHICVLSDKGKEKFSPRRVSSTNII